MLFMEIIQIRSKINLGLIWQLNCSLLFWRSRSDPDPLWYFLFFFKLVLYERSSIFSHAGRLQLFRSENLIPERFSFFHKKTCVNCSLLTFSTKRVENNKSLIKGCAKCSMSTRKSKCGHSILFNTVNCWNFYFFIFMAHFAKKCIKIWWTIALSPF
jgi:hypothetical protein